MANEPRRPWQQPPRRAPAPQQPPQESGLGVLGGLAIALGLGALGAYMLDWHRHSCPCGYRWSHFGAFNMNDEASHRCSACGQVQWWKCGAPHVLTFGEGSTQPPGQPSQPSQLRSTMLPPPPPARPLQEPLQPPLLADRGPDRVVDVGRDYVEPAARPLIERRRLT